MITVEKNGKTVDEAIEAALEELNVTRDQIDYEVLEEPSKGLFGFLGGKPARVLVKVKNEVKDELKPIEKADEQEIQLPKIDPVVVAKEFLTKVFDAMKLDVKIEKLSSEEGFTLNLRGDDLGILIGKHGQTLDALQYLTNLAAHRDVSDRVRITLDVEDYRKRRADTLIRLAKRLADNVKLRGEKIVLEPMTPQERKIIHMALQDDLRVTTFSEGEEPFRKVIIALKK